MTAIYRGRIAPTPTGYLHLGHYRTFHTAWERARAAGGALVLRIEDIDPARCRPEFAQGAIEDLSWAGLDWDEGPDIGGPFAPYVQSRRLGLYREAFEKLRASGALFPCTCSRRDVTLAAAAPHAEDAEPIYPGTCRERIAPSQSTPLSTTPSTPPMAAPMEAMAETASSQSICWRLRVPDGETISFVDGRMGAQASVSGRDFGDFIVWRRDDAPAYELAVVVDDAAMQITEVVRGADLLLSTARQLLLYRALGLAPPTYYHCELLRDPCGRRLAKRNDALSLRQLRERGVRPHELADLRPA